MQAVDHPGTVASNADTRSLAAALRAQGDPNVGALAAVRRLVRAPGLVAALVAAAAAGLGDGVITFSSVPVDGRTPGLLVAVLFHCVAVLVPVGIVLGFCQDVLMHGFMRNPLVRVLRFQLKGGPRGWFETNAYLATRVFALASGSASLAILALAAVERASGRIREPALIALAAVG